MNGWLPESHDGFAPTPGLAERIISGVKARNERRKKIVREAWAGLGTAAFVAIVALLVLPAAHITAGRAQRPSPTVQAIRPASPGAGNASFVGAALRGRPALGPTTPAIESGRAQRPSPTTTKEPAPGLTLSKVDHLVEVAWQGDKNGEYVVYRCTSPKFDQCSLADRVKGTTWVDTANEPGIIYYMVEPTAGNGRGNG
jgi:hypothetical protein